MELLNKQGISKLRFRDSLLVATLILGTLGCGDENGPGNEESKLPGVNGTSQQVTTIQSQDAITDCNASNEGKLYWVKSRKSFAVCEDSEIVFIDIGQSSQAQDGASGSDGSPGEDGEDGADGENGTNGEDGKPAIILTAMYDANENLIGDRINNASIENLDAGESVIILSDDSIAVFDNASGELADAVTLDTDDGLIVASDFCMFTSYDCSGPCYSYQSSAGNFKPLKGAIYRAGTNLARATGDEEIVSNLTIASTASESDPDECNEISLGSEVAVGQAAEIAVGYELPNALTLPLATPVMFDNID